MRKNFSPGLPGVAALITMLAVLCMAVFSVLTLSTVLSAQRLTQSAAEHSAAWYAAEAEAEERLAAQRQSGEVGECSFTVPVSDTLSLCVSVRTQADGSYEILRWQQVYTADWTADTSLDVWSGE